MTGLTVAAWESLPELVPTRRRRLIARGAVAAGAIPLLVALAPGRAVAFRAAADTEHDSYADLAQRASALADPRLAALAAAGMTAGVVVMRLGESRGKEAIVRRLGGWGVPLPRTTLGVAAGALAAAVTYLDETNRP